MSGFQGVATDKAGKRLPDGNITLTLRYYSSWKSGTLYYAEQFLNTPVRNGLFVVAMGTGTPLAGGTSASFVEVIRANGPVYVAPSINADPEMVTAVPILSAPYALRAQTADTLGLQSPDYYLNIGPAAQQKSGPLTISASTAPTTGALKVTQAGAGAWGIEAYGNIGVVGYTYSGGAGVHGRVISQYGVGTWGVIGVNDGPVGMGVSGSSHGNGTSTTGDAIGVDGSVGYPTFSHAFRYAAGVRGQTDVGDGVQGASTLHSGVYGYSNYAGVYGEAVYDPAVLNATHFGVYGLASSAPGVGVGGDSGAGLGVMGRSTTNYGVVGRSESGTGVKGQSKSGNGPSTGVEGASGTGIGVNGIATLASGVAVKASGHGADGVALQLDNGPIKVSGANPTAFTVIAPTLVSVTWFYLDNALTNGDPNAIIIVTPNMTPPGGAAVYNPHPVGVYYVAGPQKWIIENVDGGAMVSHAAFNVLVIKK